MSFINSFYTIVITTSLQFLYKFNLDKWTRYVIMNIPSDGPHSDIYTWSYMEAFESKWVNSILNIIGVNLLRLGGLHIKVDS